MSATFYFPDFHADEEIADIAGSSFGEPDDTTHRVEVLEGNGHLIIRVQLQESDEPVDLLFMTNQAEAFHLGVKAVIDRLGIDVV